MTRQQTIEVILRERDYQDKKWPHDKPPRCPGGSRLLDDQYRLSAPHILLAEEYIKKARERWTKSGDYGGGEALKTLAKAAAILLRALEEIDGPNLLETGLR